MPPTPPKFKVRLPTFPLPVGVGTDICSISRIKTILRKPRRGQDFVKRILSPYEPRPRAVDLDHSRPVPPASYPSPAAAAAHGRDSIELHRAATFLAGRFAAKEAAFKAHQGRHLGFQDVLILPFRQLDGGQVEVDMWAKPGIVGGFGTGPWMPWRGLRDGKDGGLVNRGEKKDDGKEGAVGTRTGDGDGENSTEETLHTSRGSPLRDWVSYLDRFEPQDQKLGAEPGSEPMKEPSQESDIEAESNPGPETYVSGAPIAVIHGSPVAQISISHDGEYAIATCISYTRLFPNQHETEDSLNHAAVQQVRHSDGGGAGSILAPHRPLPRPYVRPTTKGVLDFKQSGKNFEMPPSMKRVVEHHQERIRQRLLNKFLHDSGIILKRGENILSSGGRIVRASALLLGDPSGPPIRFQVEPSIPRQDRLRQALKAANSGLEDILVRKQPDAILSEEYNEVRSEIDAVLVSGNAILDKGKSLLVVCRRALRRHGIASRWHPEPTEFGDFTWDKECRELMKAFRRYSKKVLQSGTTLLRGGNTVVRKIRRRQMWRLKNQTTGSEPATAAATDSSSSPHETVPTLPRTPVRTIRDFNTLEGFMGMVRYGQRVILRRQEQGRLEATKEVEAELDFENRAQQLRRQQQLEHRIRRRFKLLNGKRSQPQPQPQPQLQGEARPRRSKVQRPQDSKSKAWKERLLFAVLVVLMADLVLRNVDASPLLWKKSKTQEEESSQSIDEGTQ